MINLPIYCNILAPEFRSAASRPREHTHFDFKTLSWQQKRMSALLVHLGCRFLTSKMKKNGPERSSNFKTYISMFDNTVKALIDDIENVIGHL